MQVAVFDLEDKCCIVCLALLIRQTMLAKSQDNALGLLFLFIRPFVDASTNAT